VSIFVGHDVVELDALKHIYGVPNKKLSYRREAAQLSVIETFKHSSRSMEMALYDRSYTAYYWSATVCITLSCTIVKLFNAENNMTLKSG